MVVTSDFKALSWSAAVMIKNRSFKVLCRLIDTHLSHLESPGLWSTEESTATSAPPLPPPVKLSTDKCVRSGDAGWFSSRHNKLKATADRTRMELERLRATALCIRSLFSLNNLLATACFLCAALVDLVCLMTTNPLTVVPLGFWSSVISIEYCSWCLAKRLLLIERSRTIKL
uniref:Uncharacterized protein n=1 Tax=Romanomermis culicivorax TaxID=13658 RepID=A0A915JG14_ROMCU